MKLDPSKIKESAKDDFRTAWLETASLIPQDGGDFTGGVGKPHIMWDLIAKVREVFLNLGFDEVENQVFIPEEDVYKQYGPEAPVILDRCYYLGGLTRPDIGISQDKMTKVKEIAPVSEKGLQKLFRSYREGKIEGDDVLETMVERFSIETDEAARIIDLFPEFKDIKPVCGKTTLRSHMTAAWFPTLSALQDEVPAKLFSCGMRYRREQKVDSSHLRAHYGGSCVIMAEDISLKAGKDVTENILNALDFGDVTYVKKKATSNYYAPGSEYEVYSGDIEVADIGMYSPVALSEYDIEYNVFNLGFGLERVLMVKNSIPDVRQVLYPQFYSTRKYTDEELAKEIAMAKKPATDGGLELASGFEQAFRKNADADSPCSFPAFDGEVCGKRIRAAVVEREDGSQLAGPAALNKIYVYEGGVYALPEDCSNLKFDVSDIKDNGVLAGFDILDAVSNGLAAQIEEAVDQGDEKGFFQYKMAKAASDANIRVSRKALRFIESKNQRVSIKGPVFCAAEFELA